MHSVFSICIPAVSATVLATVCLHSFASCESCALNADVYHIFIHEYRNMHNDYLHVSILVIFQMVSKSCHWSIAKNK